MSADRFMPAERRTKRVQAPLLAAQYFLDGQRARNAVKAIVLFDGPDVLVSSAETPRDRAFSVAWAWDALTTDGPLEHDVYFHTVEILGRSMTLATIDARLASVVEATRGLVRILSR